MQAMGLVTYANLFRETGMQLNDLKITITSWQASWSVVEMKYQTQLTGKIFEISLYHSQSFHMVIFLR